MNINLSSLPLSHAMDNCLYQQGNKQCRYLSEKEDRENEFICLKMMPNQKRIIDNEAKIFETRKSQMHNNPILKIAPLGDNCKGFDHKKNNFVFVGA
jgi:hypothetical protein